MNKDEKFHQYKNCLIETHFVVPLQETGASTMAKTVIDNPKAIVGLPFSYSVPIKWALTIKHAR
jgi:hypothetical protein